MFIVKTIYEKPDGTKWFEAPLTIDVQPLRALLSNHAGLKKNKTRKIGKNKRVNIRVFDSQEDYNNFVAELNNLPFHQAAKAYQIENNITSVIHKFLKVE